MTTLMRSLYSIFFPEHCHACKKPGSALCTSCITRIALAPELPRHTYAIYDYGNSLVKWSIRELKYHNRSERARALADTAVAHIEEYLAEHFQSISLQSFTLVPIPEHVRKQRARGFNQSLLLAKWWSSALPQTRVQNILRKTVFTLPQAKLNRSARLKNVMHTMQCDKPLDPRHLYIVVDDVTTTGATFDEARRALGSAGAKKILCIALAHGYGKK